MDDKLGAFTAVTLTYLNGTPLDAPLASVGMITVTRTVPGDSVGLFAVIVAEFKTETSAACFVPKRTASPCTKLDPVIVTRVPPRSGPARGEIDTTPGRCEATGLTAIEYGDGGLPPAAL